MAFESIIKNRPGYRPGSCKTKQSLPDLYLTTTKNYRNPDGGKPILCLSFSPKLIRRMDWKIGNRLDVLFDPQDRTGLIRKDPDGLTLSYKGSKKNHLDGKKQMSGVLRISGLGWMTTTGNRVEIPHCINQEELMFELPPEVSLTTAPTCSITRLEFANQDETTYVPMEEV